MEAGTTQPQKILPEPYSETLPAPMQAESSLYRNPTVTAETYHVCEWYISKDRFQITHAHRVMCRNFEIHLYSIFNLKCSLWHLHALEAYFLDLLFHLELRFLLRNCATDPPLENIPL